MLRRTRLIVRRPDENPSEGVTRELLLVPAIILVVIVGGLAFAQAENRFFACKNTDLQDVTPESLLIDYDARTVTYNEVTSPANISPTTVSWSYVKLNAVRFDCTFDRVTGQMSRDQRDHPSGRFRGTSHLQCAPAERKY